MKLPVATDELVAIGALLISLAFTRYPISSTIAGVAVVYLLICVFFRKYEDAHRRLKK